MNLKRRRVTEIKISKDLFDVLPQDVKDKKMIFGAKIKVSIFSTKTFSEVTKYEQH